MRLSSRHAFTGLVVAGLLLGGVVLPMSLAAKNRSSPQAAPDDVTSDARVAGPPLGAFKIFTAPKYVDLAHRTGEPSVKVGPEGNVYGAAPSSLSRGNQGWFWRSTDKGVTWDFVSNVPVVEKRIAPEIGGGDSDLAVTPGGRIYYADLWLGDISVARSDDAGLTWTQGTVLASDVPANDRQWLGVYGENVVYLAYNQVPYGPMVSKSVDGGTTWVTAPAVTPQQGANAFFIGNLVVDPRTADLHFVYSACGAFCADQIWFVSSHDGGLTWTQTAVREGGGNVGNLFPVLAEDAAGNFYVAWSEVPRNGKAAQVYTSSSTNGGRNWSAPKLVSAGLGNAMMPWIVAGRDGATDLVFYGTDYAGDAASAPATTRWWTYFALSLNSHAATPRYYVGATSVTPNHLGSICNQGLNCDLNGGDRSLLDFFQVTLDPEGHANVLYADNHELAPFEDPYVTYVRQFKGTSLT